MDLGPISGISGVNKVGGSSASQREFRRRSAPDRPRRKQDDAAYTGSEEQFEDEAEDLVEEPVEELTDEIAEEMAEEMTTEGETSAETDSGLDADSADSGTELNLFA